MKAKDEKDEEHIKQAKGKSTANQKQLPRNQNEKNRRERAVQRKESRQTGKMGKKKKRRARLLFLGN